MKVDKKIVRLRKEQPLLTGSAISRKLQISRQYVSRVLKEADLNNKQPQYKKVVVTCKICGKVTPRGQMLCPEGECNEKYYLVDVQCSFCHSPFQLKRGVVKQSFDRGLKHIYCSRSCYAKGKSDGLS